MTHLKLVKKEPRMGTSERLVTIERFSTLAEFAEKMQHAETFSRDERLVAAGMKHGFLECISFLTRSQEIEDGK